MSLLTKADALARSQAVSVTWADVSIDLRSGATDALDYPVTSLFTCEVRGGDMMIDVAGTVEAVTVDGAAVPFTTDDHHVYLTGVPRGTRQIGVSARCRYSTNGQGLHRYVDPEDGRVYCYTHFEPMDAHTAWPCFDQPDIKPRWRFSVIAPAHWEVRNNQPAVETETVSEGVVLTRFAPTPPLSAYLSAIIAGDFAVVPCQPWTGTLAGEDQSVDLTFLCRQALVDDMDVEDLERVTRQGLTFFTDRYRFAYPWGKYDQVFVPEYSIGAMENPGLVTFNEHFIRRGGPTRSSRQGLASTVLHEMCHMWFGDLVTPKWWDDLWLKESFADHEGTEALVKATEYTTGWAAFTLEREGWAHAQDQLPTTHPILATIDDVEAAKQNFDGITYAKGACVIRQLVAWVGPTAFVTATRAYFAAHAFSSATFTDLIDALTEASQRDVQGWADAWLATPGPSILSAEDEAVAQLPSPVDPAGTLRPHRLAVARLNGDGENLVLGPVAQIELPASADLVQTGEEAPVLLNVTGATYGVLRQDPETWELALDRLSTLANPDARAVIWLSMIDAVRDGLLDVTDVLRRAPLQADGEDEALRPSAVAGLRGMLRFVPRELIDDVARPLASQVTSFLGDADRVRLDAWLPMVADLYGRGTPSEAERECVTGLLDNPLVSIDHRWSLITALAAQGEWGEAEIEEFRRSHDATGRGAMRAALALAARPGVEEEVTEQLWSDLSLTNERANALIAGLHMPTHAPAHSATRYVASIVAAWQARPLHMAIKLAEGMFPGDVDIADGGAADHPVVVAITKFLDECQLEPALRRVVTECQDETVRRLLRQEETLAHHKPSA
ncbi:MAG: aminopeptidase N [Actinomycetaceae bacterium]|nr:aminopeptidase N [Actinomycetaceae bacterium]